MPASPLFRQEAVDFQSQRFYGRIVLRQPWPATVLTAMFACIAALLVMMFFCCGFTRQERVAGLVMPDRGLIVLVAQHAGVVVEKRAVEGQRVRAGDVLFVLSNERSTARGETQRSINLSLTSRIGSLRDELAERATQASQRQDGLRRRRTEILAQLQALQSELQLQTKRSAYSRQVARSYAAVDRDYVARLSVTEKTADALQEGIALQRLRRSQYDLREELQRLDAEALDLPLQARREAAALQRSIAEAEQGLAESEARRQTFVRAAEPGLISSVSVELGQSVSDAQALVAMIPEGASLETVLYAPSRAVGFARAGTPVTLRFEAFPYEKYGQFHGVVREVSRSPVLASDLPASMADRAQSDTVCYRLRVIIDEEGLRKDFQLKAGMRAEGSLLLERRKLYEWVFQPLLKLAGPRV